MAIGLSKVNSRKAPRSSSKKVHASVTDAAAEILASAEVDGYRLSDVWSTRGLAREGRSSRRERGSSSGDLNMLWFDWTECVAGSFRSTRVLEAIRRLLDLELFIFEFLVYDLEVPQRAKKRILKIRSRNEKLFSLISKEA